MTTTAPETFPGRRSWLALLAFVAFVLLFRLGGRGLNEPDEGRYANIALGMLDPDHSVLEPRMSEFGHYDKPPLTYWVTALSFQLFGRSEAAARLPSLFGALLALGSVGWAGFRLYGRETAWWTVLMGVTVGQFWLLARFLSPDMLLTGWTTLAIAAWVEARQRGGSWGWWLLSLLAWTAAWWTKATAALVPLLGLAVGLLIRRDREGLRTLRPGRLLLGILVLGSPWYLFMMRQHPELVDFFLGREVVGRIAGHPDGRKAPVFFHVLVTLGAWLPWWPTILATLAWQGRGRLLAGIRAGWREWPLELWIVLTGLAVFSAISSKLPTYTVPFAPWVAVFCAGQWQRLIAAGRFVPAPRRRFVTAGAFAAAYLLVTFIAPRLESRQGRNSSTRQLGGFLREQRAGMVFCDRYWPGLEFYYGKRVQYVLPKSPQQRSDDAGISAELGESHFPPPARWAERLPKHRGETVWLVTLRQTVNSPLAAGRDRGVVTATNRVGDFVLWQLQVPRGPAN